MKKAMYVALAVVFAIGAMVGLASAAPNVGNVQQQGSVVVYSKVVVEGTVNGAGVWQTITTDTILTMVNNFRGSLNPPDPGDVNLECYWMTEEQANQSFSWQLTHTDPDYVWASSFMPGRRTGLADPVTGDYPAIGLGEVKCWAVSFDFADQIKFNWLFGTAVIYDFGDFTAEQYSSMNFRALVAGANRIPVGTPGEIKLDGVQYDGCPARVMGTFFPTTAEFTFADPAITIDAFTTDLTLVPCAQSLGQDYVPVYGKAEFLFWDSDETRNDGIYVCYKCWMETTLTPVPVKSTGVTKVVGFSLFDQLDGNIAYFEAKGVKNTACAPDPAATPTPIFGVIRHRAQINGNLVSFATHLNATSSIWTGADPSIFWYPEEGGPQPEMVNR